jgi:hypothetical protein
MRSKYGTAVLEVFEKPLVIHPNWPDLQCGGEDAIVRLEAEGRCGRCVYFFSSGCMDIDTPCRIGMTVLRSFRGCQS